MSIEIISSGLQTTIQDLGREGLAHMGVPLSGGADKLSIKVANYLLGNDINSPVIECTLTGPTLRFLKPYSIAITGANMNARINDKEIKMYEVVKVKTNDILTMNNCLIGCRSYISLSEKIIAKKFLGSLSTYLPANVGGLGGKALSKGSLIESESYKTKLNDPSSLNLDKLKPLTNKSILKVFEGPEFNLLTEPSKKEIFSGTYVVSNDSSRIGNRLDGKELKLVESGKMISCPVSIGTIQCPSNGLPIILGCDSQTLGGYPRILQTALVDLDLIGQLRPKDKIQFKKISLEQGIEHLKKQQEK